MGELEEYFESISQEDQEYINKQELGEKKMEPTYNKVQYSEFTDDRKGQWVFRGDTVEEVDKMRKEVFGLVGTVPKPIMQAVREFKPLPQAPVVNPTPQTPVGTNPPLSNPNIGPNASLLKKYNYDFDDKQIFELTHPCKKCGNEMAFNHNTGKIFCSKKCWLVNN